MSGTHANPLGLKTDAPPEVMWDIMRCWVAEHPSKKPLDPDSYEGGSSPSSPELRCEGADPEQFVMALFILSLLTMTMWYTHEVVIVDS